MARTIIIATEAELQARDDARDRLLICMSDAIQYLVEGKLDDHTRGHLCKLISGFQIDLLRTSKQLYGEPRSYFVDHAGNPIKREDQ